MIKIKRIDEDLTVNNIEKIEPKIIKFKIFKLGNLLNGLENERPGIINRVNGFIRKEKDPYFSPQDVRGLNLPGRLYSLNLFYYGVGDEYPIKANEKYPDEVEHCHKTFPESFIEGEDREMRLDFNLIWSVYEDDIEDVENFLVSV